MRISANESMPGSLFHQDSNELLIQSTLDHNIEWPREHLPSTPSAKEYQMGGTRQYCREFLRVGDPAHNDWLTQITAVVR